VARREFGYPDIFKKQIICVFFNFDVGKYKSNYYVYLPNDTYAILW